MTPVEVTQGDGPIVLGMPHTGTWVPDDIWRCLNNQGRALADTDWHIHQLYEGLLPNATTVRATFHRYVIDANRDPSGESLYPGQNTTGLVPLTDFDGVLIWETPPTEADVVARKAAFHTAYHTALQVELDRVREKHGVAILYDCHSIRSHIPYLFDGVLPDFNIGTNNGQTCAPVIAKVVTEICQAAEGFGTVVNGRFKGGWTTRHYGRPEIGQHAIQMELAQSTYMKEIPDWDYLPDRADITRKPLKELLGRLDRLAREGELT